MFFSALLFSMMSFAGVVTFGPADFLNQGTTGTGSYVEATKDGVTVSCDKGFGNTYALRCYKEGVVTISASETISSLAFTFDTYNDRYYNGDLEESYTVGATSWSATLTNQARFTSITVTLGEGGETPDQPEEPETPETPDTPAPEGVITCAEAVAICEATGETATTETYTIRGYVTGIKEAYTDQYKNVSCWMADEKGGGQVFLAFRVKPINAADQAVKVNDYIEVTGNLVNYYGNTPETTAGGSMTIITAGEGGETPDTDVVNVKDLSYADALYYEEEGTALWEIQLYNFDEAAEAYMMPIVFLGVEAKSKTSLNGTYDMLLALYGTTFDEDTYEVDGVWNDETIAATLTIKNVDNENHYSFVGTFVGEDGKTYKINTIANVWAFDDATDEEIVLSEESTPTTDGAVTFDADVDQGNASETVAAYEVAKNGVTMAVSSGRLGIYNDETHYRIYKNQTLTLTSTVGNIVKVEFTCTANDDAQYGPGCFTVNGGDYTYAGPVGTWTGSASEIVFSASVNQVRATQVVVTLESTGTGVEDVVTVEVPVKVIENGQLMIIRGENVYNVLGAQVK